jgi:hypothetical protein
VSISKDDISREIGRKVAAMMDYDTYKNNISVNEATQMFTQGYAGVTYETPIETIVTGRDGTIWLQRGSFAKQQAEWIAFDSALDPVGTVTLPTTVRVLYVSRTAVWASATDEDDIPYVVRYRVGAATKQRARQP